MSRLRYLISDLGYWVRGHLGRVPLFVLGALVLAGIAFGAYAGIKALSKNKTSKEAPAPPAVVHTETKVVKTSELGFPAFATRNTTRVGGDDAATDAAGAALATFPGVKGPPAVTIVDQDDWSTGVAAASLVAAPVGAPILMSSGGELGELTNDALSSLDPGGIKAGGGVQAFVAGDAATPDGLKAKKLNGPSPADIAVEIAKERRELTGHLPAHVVVTSLDKPAYAMPAAAWSARSGDPVLYGQRDSIPAPTLAEIRALGKRVPVFVLAPKSVISAAAVAQITQLTPNVKRVSAANPVDSAIKFARYAKGDFGWNITDPGHGFVIANSSRPADAAAATRLSASGTWGPLLLTDSATTIPDQLQQYLLDVKPGYEDDPTRAVYNHLWLMGNEAAISVAMQAQLDEIAEVAPVQPGNGASILGPPVGGKKKAKKPPKPPAKTPPKPTKPASTAKQPKQGNQPGKPSNPQNGKDATQQNGNTQQGGKGGTK